jgi:SAM-dependent methyltransferase
MTGQTVDVSREQEAARSRLRGMWSAVAPAWGEHADFVERRGAAVTERMLELVTPAQGERVLELAAGAGGVGLAAAPLVAPDGEVVVSDFVAEMTEIAAIRAAAHGLDNVETRVLDLEQIEQPDASFDLVLCREGLMFAVDPALAAGEIRRVLRPGGRVAVAVWGPREANPWLGIVLDAVGAQLGVPVPPPGMPGPFALGAAGRLAEVLSAGGLADVSVEELALPLRAPSFDDWWTRTCALAGPVSSVLASFSTEAAAALRERAHTAVAAYETADGIELPGVTLIATGRA